MAPNNHRECYGNLFPDLSQLESAVPCEGKAFRCTMRRSYGLGPNTAELHVDAAQWDQCLACPEYRGCYDLSAAKLMLATGMRVRT